MPCNRKLILGDTHAHWQSLGRLFEHILRTHLKDDSLIFTGKLDHDNLPFDEIIHVGDLGFWPGFTSCWYPEFTSKGKPIRMRWVDGNHEHFHRLHQRDTHFGQDSDPTEQALYTPWVKPWQDFLQHWEYQPRGTVEDGVLFIGGAFSIDRGHRTLGVDWFTEEMISYADQERVYTAIEEVGAANIHTVISHDCPKRFPVLDEVERINGSIVRLPRTPNRDFLDHVFTLVSPKRWLFGHYHVPWSQEIDGCIARCVSLNADYDYVIETF